MNQKTCDTYPIANRNMRAEILSRDNLWYDLSSFDKRYHGIARAFEMSKGKIRVVNSDAHQVCAWGGVMDIVEIRDKKCAALLVPLPYGGYEPINIRLIP